MSPDTKQQTVDALEVGQSLRRARVGCGLTTRVVARRLTLAGFPISHATVANYEKGRSIPSLALIQGLARIYGCQTESLRSPRPPLVGQRYRCLKAVTKRQKEDFAARAVGWLLAYMRVERLLRRKQTWEPFRADPTESGRKLAGRVRERLEVGPFPLPSVVRVLENLGVRTIGLETDARIDAFAASFENCPVVVLNSSLAPDRMRLTAAHELAHHLYSDCVRNHRLDDDDVEKRAFEFASHLLLPDAMLKKAFQLKSMVRLVQYKERFGISLAAMIFRAKESGLINERLYHRLWVDFAKLGWRTDEPGTVIPDRPQRMEALFDGAVRQKKTTYAAIAQMAGVDEALIRQRVMRAMGATDEEEVVADYTSPLRFRSSLEDVDFDKRKD